MRYTTKCGPGRYDLVRGLGPLELPRCEAPQVKVDFAAFGSVVVTGELQLVFQLVLANGFLTDAADPPTPGPPQIRAGSRRGSLPVRMAKRANSRRGASSGKGFFLPSRPWGRGILGASNHARIGRKAIEPCGTRLPVGRATHSSRRGEVSS
jgi:hypothetical protein